MVRIRKNITTSIVEWCLQFFIIFGFVFEMPLISFFTTRRVSILLMIIYLIINKGKVRIYTKKINKNVLYASFFCFVICLGITLVNNIGLIRKSGNNYFEAYYIIYEILYILIAGVYVVTSFESLKKFAQIYISIMLIQSFIVYIAAISYPFRQFLYDNFYFEDDRFASTIKWGTRIIGLDLYASLGSIILFSGCVLLVTLALNNSIENALFIVEYIIIMIATMLVGRTGFYFEIILLIVYLILERKITKKIINIFIIGMLSIIGLQFIMSKINPTIAQKLVEWIGEAFNSSTRYDTINTIQSMKVPQFSSSMWFGTNVTLGYLPNGQAMFSDSGYLKMYCALGIIGAIIYYGAFLLLFLSNRVIKLEKRNKIYIYILIVVSFVIEYKEPFFYKYIYAWITYSVLLFQNNTLSNEVKRNG